MLIIFLSGSGTLMPWYRGVHYQRLLKTGGLICDTRGNYLIKILCFRNVRVIKVYQISFLFYYKSCDRRFLPFLTEVYLLHERNSWFLFEHV